VFGFHWPELIVVLVIALVFFGPKRLPEVGNALGKTITEFRKSTSGHNDEPRLPHDSDRIGSAPVDRDVPSAAGTGVPRQDRDAS
jgi:sec-independent protein translocase protein TatA